LSSCEGRDKLLEPLEVCQAVKGEGYSSRMSGGTLKMGELAKMYHTSKVNRALGLAETKCRYGGSNQFLQTNPHTFQAGEQSGVSFLMCQNDAGHFEAKGSSSGSSAKSSGSKGSDRSWFSANN